MGPVAVDASRATFTQVPVGTGVFCNGNATGAAARISGTPSGVTEALAAWVVSFDDRGFLDFLGPVAVKELERGYLLSKGYNPGSQHIYSRTMPRGPAANWLFLCLCKHFFFYQFSSDINRCPVESCKGAS